MKIRKNKQTIAEEDILKKKILAHELKMIKAMGWNEDEVIFKD